MSVDETVAQSASKHLDIMAAHLDKIIEADGLPRVKKAVPFPSWVLRQMELALQSYDRFLKTVIDEAPLMITCGPGCSNCCYDSPTGVRGLELLLVYNQYRRFSDFRQLHNGACDRWEMLRENLRQSTFRHVDELKTDSPQFRNGQLRYRRRKIQCMFLDDQGKCRVYSVRPIACRMHFSLDDPDHCEANHLRAKKAMSINLPPPSFIIERLDAIDKRLGLDLTRVFYRGITELGSTILEGAHLKIKLTHRRPISRKRQKSNVTSDPTAPQNRAAGSKVPSTEQLELLNLTAEMGETKIPYLRYGIFSAVGIAYAVFLFLLAATPVKERPPLLFTNPLQTTLMKIYPGEKDFHAFDVEVDETVIGAQNE